MLSARRLVSKRRAKKRLDYQPLFREMSPRSPLLGKAHEPEKAAEIDLPLRAAGNASSYKLIHALFEF